VSKKQKDDLVFALEIAAEILTAVIFILPFFMKPTSGNKPSKPRKK
jgi:hypothetical protein